MHNNARSWTMSAQCIFAWQVWRSIYTMPKPHPISWFSFTFHISLKLLPNQLYAWFSLHFIFLKTPAKLINYMPDRFLGDQFIQCSISWFSWYILYFLETPAKLIICLAGVWDVNLYNAQTSLHLLILFAFYISSKVLPNQLYAWQVFGKSI